MYVRKNKISHLLKKEREKERQRCEKDTERQIKSLKSNLENKNSLIIKDLQAEHKKNVLELSIEIRRLKEEIEKNYSTYMEVRMREKKLQELSVEMEAEIAKMVTRVHESTQPFYRTMSKVESAKKKSDKKHEKVDRIFSVVS